MAAGESRWSWSGTVQICVTLFCVLYCTVLMSEIKALRMELDLLQVDGSQHVPEVASSYHRSKRSVQDQLHMGQERHKRTASKKKRYAAHYEPFATPAYIKKNFPRYDDDGWHYSKNMKGHISNNQDFETNSSTGILNIFDKVSWTKKLRKQRKLTEPFKVKDHGMFVVRKPGLYLVYAQVLFNDTVFDQAVVLRQFNKKGTLTQQFYCYQSVVSNVMTHFRSSCSIIGLMNLSRGDYLVLVIEPSHVIINIKDGGTYIGAMMLT